MNEPVDVAEVHERAEVRNGLYGARDDLAAVERVQCNLSSFDP